MWYELIEIRDNPDDIVLYTALLNHLWLLGQLTERNYILGRADRPIGYIARDAHEVEGKKRGMLRPLNLFDNFRALPTRIGIYQEVTS